MSPKEIMLTVLTAIGVVLLAFVLLWANAPTAEPPNGICDYCHDKARVWLFHCEECKKVHYSCIKEKSITRAGWSLVTIVNCPQHEASH